jgi:hypothetical protein
MAEPMNFSAYARRIGVSQPYISQLVAQGVIPLVPGKKMIDPEQADAAIAQHRDVSKQYTVDRNAQARAAKAADASPAPAPRSEPMNSPAMQIANAHSKARAMRETFVARQAELEYRERIGELIERAQSDRAILDAVGPILSRLESLGARAAPKVAGETDVRSIADAIDDEVAEIRQELADTLRAMAASAEATKQ